MLSTISRKNKINLLDYPYKRDIANRLFLARLGKDEVEVLDELLFHPSKCRISDLELDTANLREILHDFSQIGFTMLEGDRLFIDKELRKYFEFHINKFQDNFEPSFESLQELLNRVPISILPNWYSIPKMSDNIFESIVEKYLETPKIYQSYLNEVSFDDPIIRQIMDDVFASPDLKIETETLCHRYKISQEKLQEYILLLEFHFIVASSFDNHKEVIRPFQEWADYLRFQKKTTLTPLDEKLVRIEKKPISIATREEQEDAMDLFRKTCERWQSRWGSTVEKDVFEVEKALRDIPGGSWICLNNFIEGLTLPIGACEPVTLKRVGKRWKYNLPSYTDEEKVFIEHVLTDLLHSVGITATGSVDGTPCFMITPYGRVTLGSV